MAQDSTSGDPLYMVPTDGDSQSEEQSNSYVSKSSAAAGCNGDALADGVFTSPISVQAKTREPDSFTDNRIYVSNIPFSFTEQDLVAMFTPHGQVLSVEIVCNSRGSKGFGFVTLETIAACEKARSALHQTHVQGRIIEVRRATQASVRKPKPLPPMVSEGYLPPCQTPVDLRVPWQFQQHMEPMAMPPMPDMQMMPPDIQMIPDMQMMPPDLQMMPPDMQLMPDMQMMPPNMGYMMPFPHFPSRNFLHGGTYVTMDEEMPIAHPMIPPPIMQPNPNECWQPMDCDGTPNSVMMPKRTRSKKPRCTKHWRLRLDHNGDFFTEEGELVTDLLECISGDNNNLNLNETYYDVSHMSMTSMPNHLHDHINNLLDNTVTNSTCFAPRAASAEPKDQTFEFNATELLASLYEGSTSFHAASQSMRVF